MTLRNLGCQRPLLARLAGADHHRRRARQGAHRRGAARQAGRGAGGRRDPGGGRLPGRRPAGAARHPGPRRRRPLGGGGGGGAAAPTAATSTPTSTASTPPIRASRNAPGGWPGSPTRRCWRWPRWARKVLQSRSVELAMAQRVPLRVLSSFVEPGAADNQGTIVCDEEEIVEKRIVSGVAYSRDEAKISLFGLPDHPGVASDDLRPPGRRQRQRRHDRAEPLAPAGRGQHGVHRRQARRGAGARHRAGAPRTRSGSRTPRSTTTSPRSR